MRVALVIAAVLAGCGGVGGPPLVDPIQRGVAAPAACGVAPAAPASGPRVRAPTELDAVVGQRVAAVEIDGADATRAQAAAIVRTTVGAALDPAAVALDLARLARLGVYTELAARWEPRGADAGALHLIVVEAPRVVEVAVDAPGVSPRTLRLLRGLRGTIADPARADRALAMTRGVLAVDGFVDATGAIWSEPLAAGVRVCARLEPGPRALIAAVRFAGVAAFPEAELRAAVGTPGGPNGVGGPYHRGRLVADLTPVWQRYRDAGYLDVVFDEPIVTARPAGLTVELPVREGARRVVGAIEVGQVPDDVDRGALVEVVERELAVGRPLGGRGYDRAVARLSAHAAALDPPARARLELATATATGVTALTIEVWR
ncbi:MAG: hypothetical protein IPL61_19020 [Myxococcales bacterium]|nr:hypothetical protein [Myxococcales bacterium]